MRRQLDISKQMNANLVEESKELENTIEDMYHKLKPVTSMNNAVAVCKGNMHAAMECI
jgi:tetrahydromethanopterin S-methyltransferase subunit B